MRLVPALDGHGTARLGLNVLVLQQALKAVQPSASLESARRFYELAALGPEAVAGAGNEGFEEESLRVLGRLLGG